LALIPQPRIDEIVGQGKAIERLRKAILEAKPCLLYGGPGVGKTSSVYALARELGYKVHELNASDERSEEALRGLLRRVRMGGLVKMLFLLDEVDGIRREDLLHDVLSQSKHPIVMTANELRKVPKGLLKRLEVIRFEAPRLTEVINRVKQLEGRFGVRPNCSNVTHDVRSSIITSFFGSEKYRAEGELELVKKLFERGYEGEVDEGLLIWLLDNVTGFYWGKDVWEVMEILALADLYGTRILKALPKGRGEARFPRFLLRLSGLKSQSNP